MLNRDIKLTIGDVEIIGRGGYDGFRIAFSIQKTLLGSPNIAEFRIWNLSRDTRSRIRKRQVDISMEIGYEDTGRTTIFKGQTYSAIPTQEGPDTVMTVTAMDGAVGTIYYRLH